MKLPSLNSFVVGFLVALIVLAAVFLWRDVGLVGGFHTDSPNGLYELIVTGPMDQTSGGSYTVELIDKGKSAVVRRVVVTLSKTEQTGHVRDGGGTIQWDPGSAYADVTVEGEELIRVWVP